MTDSGSSFFIIDMASSLKTRNSHGRWNKLDLRSSGLHRRLLIHSEIRPRPETLVRMAKRPLGLVLILFFTAIKVGVPVVPGTPGPVAAYTEAEAFIKEYGFPGVSLPTDCPLFKCAELSDSHHQGGDGWRRSRYEGCP